MGFEQRLIPTSIKEGVDLYEIGEELQNDFRKTDILAIVADGPCIWGDLAAWDRLINNRPYDVMCINEIATRFPRPFLHFAAGDSHQSDMQEIAASLPESVIKHAYNPTSKHFNVRWIKKYGGWSGTSTFFGLRIALAMGYMRIILIGSPLTNTGHWYDKEIKPGDPRESRLYNNHENHLWKWTELASRPIAFFIRSMSGNTKDLLGYPDKEWLDSIL
jgi:hypothetical protein